jgi:sugar/nucleoside kinase (ribokinase family)
MSNPVDVLCAGIIVADHLCTPIPHLPAAGELVLAENLMLAIGGCAANAAVDLRKMGVSSAVVGRVGGDTFGKVVLEMLGEQGVETSTVTVSPESVTSQTLIVNVMNEDRRFIHTFGANADFCVADIPWDLVSRCRVLYLGGYLVMPRIKHRELASLFAQARKHGVKTVLDVVVPGPGEYLPQLETLLPHVDVFLPNNLEGQIITGEQDPLRQAELFHKLGAKTVLVTLGGDGAVLVSDGIRLRSGVYGIPFVDGSGGGDAFDAGYIYGLLNNLPPAECLRVASALGASCVRALGTTPGVFTRSECEEFMTRSKLEVREV